MHFGIAKQKGACFLFAEDKILLVGGRQNITCWWKTISLVGGRQYRLLVEDRISLVGGRQNITSASERKVNVFRRNTESRKGKTVKVKYAL